MPTVTYIQADGTRHHIEVADGDSVMHGAVAHDLAGIVGECGGALACATCHCYVDADWVDEVGGPSSRDEADMLESTGAEVRASSRLACQIIVSDALDGLVVHLPETQF